MPSLRRRGRSSEPEQEGHAPEVPWALGALLREGARPLGEARAPGIPLDVALVLGPGRATAAAAGVPAEMLSALDAEHVEVRSVAIDDATEATDADVVLAAGWTAAPEVLRLDGVRARAVLAAADAAPLGDLGWTGGVPVLGPAWLGGTLPAGSDGAYRPRAVHRRDDVVLVHGDEPFGLLVAQELLHRREDLTIAVSGAPADLVLPFPFIGIAAGTDSLAEAFNAATVGVAPPLRGWRPAALAMLACGLAVVTPDAPGAREALGEAAAVVRSPQEAADAVEAVLGDIALRADRARAGFALAPGGWDATATALADALRDLP